MKKITIIASVFFLLGCNNSSGRKAVATGDTDNNLSANSDAYAQGSFGSEITVTLTGGPNAGTYTVTSKDPTCSEGLTSDHSFGNQYSEKDRKDNELSTVQLVIDDKDAAKTGTTHFSLEVGFGKLLDGKSYSINTRNDHSGRPAEGSGKATLMESGGARTVVIEGKTADGVSISATIKCNAVITAG
jgi:hypothetical protein